MTKFKLGDRVRVPESPAHGWGGYTGLITAAGGPGFDWRVEFKAGNGSIPGICDAAFFEHELEKVEPAEGLALKPAGEPAAAPDPDAPDWERQANRRLALELAVKSAEGTGAGRGNIVGRARAFARFLGGEGE